MAHTLTPQSLANVKVSMIYVIRLDKTLSNSRTIRTANILTRH